MSFVRINPLNTHTNRYYYYPHFICEETKSWKVKSLFTSSGRARVGTSDLIPKVHIFTLYVQKLLFLRKGDQATFEVWLYESNVK